MDMLAALANPGPRGRCRGFDGLWLQPSPDVLAPLGWLNGSTTDGSMSSGLGIVEAVSLG